MIHWSNNYVVTPPAQSECMQVELHSIGVIKFSAFLNVVRENQQSSGKIQFTIRRIVILRCCGFCPIKCDFNLYIQLLNCQCECAKMGITFC